MATTTQPQGLSSEDLARMNDLYRAGGRDRRMAPHVVYREPACPHPACAQNLQAIDFRLEDHGPAVHDLLVRAWWEDIGFVGRCPSCGGWIHFTLNAKEAVTAQDADRYPHLPENWSVGATIL